LAVIAGSVHFGMYAAVAARVLYFSQQPVAQWQLAWMCLGPVDWPVSQLLYSEVWPRAEIPWLPYALSHPRWFFIPSLVFGIFGTAWYALLGAAVGAGVTWLKRRVRRDDARP
jgi:hypothetical protein